MSIARVALASMNIGLLFSTLAAIGRNAEGLNLPLYFAVVLIVATVNTAHCLAALTPTEDPK